MHKSHNMSRITIPITVEFSWRPGRLRRNEAELEEIWRLIGSHDTFEAWFEKTWSRLGSWDAWLLRSEFLSWPLDKWESFIAAAGGVDRFSRSRISKDGFQRWQKLLQGALIRPAREWKALGLELQIPNASFQLSALPAIVFEWSGETPRAFILAETALQAMIATIQIDKLRGAEFRVCGRHDCKSVPFRADEARHKIYCSPDCAHLVAVRNSRKRAQGRRKGKGNSHGRSKTTR